MSVFRHLIISLPHCGTRTLMAFLQCQSGHTTSGINWLHKVIGDAIRRDRQLACPLRDPKDVWTSWLSRIGTEFETPRLKLFEEGWEIINELAMEYPITFVPMDLPGIRDVQMKCLIQEDVDWSLRVGHIEQQDNQARIQPDFDKIYSYPFIHQFYSL